MTVHKTEQLSKDVELKATDEERQIATGVVMVPNKVDLQGDFERPETIRDFAEDYMSRLPSGSARQGVMHAVWPDDHITLVENSVLDEDRTIAGEDVPAGSWIQSFKFEDSELWTLVRDDILSGYSIGAEDVRWSDSMAQDELPDDVDVAAGYPDDQPAWELQEGTVVENSAVDIPAVPDAEILATKDDAEKRVADYLGDREGFVDEMLERGHNEASAERLWNYLQRAADDEQADVEEADAPSGVLQRVGKAAVSALSGSRTDDDTEAAKAESEALDADKESRTLSAANRRRAMAAHDAMEDLLQSEVDFEQNRFTDDDDVNFDIGEFGKSADAGDVDADVEAGSKDAADVSMTDDNPMEDAPAWAKALHDDIEENSKQIEDLTNDGEGEEKSGDGDADGEKSLEDAPEWAKALKEQTEENAEYIEDVAKASGQSHQLEGATTQEPERKYDSSWDKTFGLSEGDA